METFERLQALRGKRKLIVEESRRSYEDATKAGRAWQGEEKEKFDRALADAHAVGDEIEGLEKLDAIERVAMASVSEPVEARGSVPKANQEVRKAELSTKVLRSFILTGNTTAMLTPDEQTEARVLQVDVDTSGGYTRPDQKFMAMLLRGVDDLTVFRPQATKFQLADAASLGVPYLSARMSLPTWTTELLTGAVDTSMAFGQRSLSPNPLAKRALVSEKLLRSSALPVENIVASELAYQFGLAEESAFLSGSGVNQPLGVFIASASGINTDRDVSTGNTLTTVTFDGLKEAKWTLKGQYHAKAKWLMSRTLLKQVDKIKDGDGQYIWSPSVLAGEPERILGFPILISDYVPTTFTTGLYVAMLGDYSYYWIADALNMRMQRLNEVYAEVGQVGFIGRLECDGMPVLSEAFIRVKLA